MNTKHPIKSKTLWFNALIAIIAAKVPEVRDWMTVYPEEVIGVVTVCNMLLRIFSGGLKL